MPFFFCFVSRLKQFPRQIGAGRFPRFHSSPGEELSRRFGSRRRETELSEILIHKKNNESWMKLCWVISPLMSDVMWRIENEIFRCLSARYEKWSVQMKIQHKYDMLIVYENYIIHASCCPPTPFFASEADHFLNTIEHRVNFCLYNCGFSFHFRRMLSLS